MTDKINGTQQSHEHGAVLFEDKSNMTYELWVNYSTIETRLDKRALYTWHDRVREAAKQGDASVVA